MANQHTQGWEPAEDVVLRALYATHTGRQLVAYLPRHTPNGIRAHARILGLSKAVPSFSEAEDALITQHYPQSGTSKLLGLLPGRKVDSIRNRAYRLGLGYTAWSPEQDAMLRQMCAAGVSYRQMQQLLGKSRGACEGRVAFLGIEKVMAPKGGYLVRKPKPVRAPRLPKVKPPKLVKEPKVKAPKPAKEPKPPKMKVVREKPAPKPKPAPAPKTDYRSLLKVAQGKKRTTTVAEPEEKLSAYLRGLPRLHPHRIAYEQLTRPGRPNLLLKTKREFLAHLENQSTPHSLAA